jgi:hypothetical protein
MSWELNPDHRLTLEAIGSGAMRHTDPAKRFWRRWRSPAEPGDQQADRAPAAMDSKQNLIARIEKI